MSSFISFWSPVLVMIFTYVKIFREARKQERTIRALTHQQMVAERRGAAAATTANSPGSAVSARRFASTSGPSSSSALHGGNVTVSKTNGNGGRSDLLAVSMANGVASEGIKLVAEEGGDRYSDICASAARGDVLIKEVNLAREDHAEGFWV